MPYTGNRSNRMYQGGKVSSATTQHTHAKNTQAKQDTTKTGAVLVKTCLSFFAVAPAFHPLRVAKHRPHDKSSPKGARTINTSSLIQLHKDQQKHSIHSRLSLSFRPNGKRFSGEVQKKQHHRHEATTTSFVPYFNRRGPAGPPQTRLLPPRNDKTVDKPARGGRVDRSRQILLASHQT